MAHFYSCALWRNQIPIFFLLNPMVRSVDFSFLTCNIDKCGPKIFCETLANTVVAVPSSHIIIGITELFPLIFSHVCIETSNVAAGILLTALWNKTIKTLKIQILIKNISLQTLWSLWEIFFKHSMLNVLWPNIIFQFSQFLLRKAVSSLSFRRTCSYFWSKVKNLNPAFSHWNKLDVN